MGNCLFAYPDRTLGSSVYASSLSYGSWSSTLPLNNVKDPQRTKVARSTDATVTSTRLKIDLGASRTVRVFAVLNHNGTVSATVRFRFYSDSGYTTLVYDSTTVNLISDNTLTTEDLTNWKPDFFFVAASDVTARYVLVEFSDTGNPAGYFELGRCCLFSAWSPTVNIDWGQGLAWDNSNTTMEQSLGGTPIFTRRTGKRVSTIKLSSLQPGEGHQYWLEMQRRLGVDGELFFVKDSAETDFWKKQQSFLGTITEQSALENPYNDTFSTGLKITELV